MVEERAFDMRKQATLCLQYFINHKDFFFFHLKDDLMGMGVNAKMSEYQF